MVAEGDHIKALKTRLSRDMWICRLWKGFWRFFLHGKGMGLFLTV